LKHERTSEEIQETAALYAMGSLNQHEAHSFETHLNEGCLVCKRELGIFEDVVAAMGLSLAEKNPPEYLRDLVTARIERTQKRESGTNARPDKKTEVRNPGAGNPPKAPPRPVFSSLSPERSSYLPWTVALALALLAGITFYAWRESDRTVLQLRQKAAVAEADAENLRTLLDVQHERAGKFDEVVKMLSSPGSRMIELKGENAGGAGALALIWDPQKSAYLVTGTLPVAPESRAYELWAITPIAKTKACILKTDPIGRVYTEAKLPPETSKVDAFAVTL
jgi:hypothetical protein